ncbi:hypothetical protein PARU111607_14645 [Palleronia rufa]
MTLSFAPDAIETWPLSRLQPYAKNAKAHGADQVAKIAASMAEFGWTVPCLVGEEGELIAGHGRVLAATQLGLTEAPVIVLGHLTEAQRRAYRIADNKLAESPWDEALLSAELNDLLADDFDLSLVGFSDGELDKLLAFVPEGDGEEGGAGGSVPPVTIPEPPRNPASRTGDLWILGDHRLLCGDSTSAADVRRLMNGERAILFATDPPYLVDYDGSNHPTRNKDWSASYGTTWDDSSQGAELYDGFIAAAVAEAITEDAAWYCWHASRRQAMLEACWEKAGAFVHQQIIWVKDRGGSDPVALPLEARALLHGLASLEPPAEGGRGNPAFHMGTAEFRQGRPARPPDAETARRIRDPDAPARRPRRPLLRAVLGLRLADHGGRGQRPPGLRDGNQPGLCRCRRRTLAGRDRPRRDPRWRWSDLR